MRKPSLQFLALGLATANVLTGLFITTLLLNSYSNSNKTNKTETQPNNTTSYYQEQLGQKLDYKDYSYTLVQRSSLNIPIEKSTDFAGVLRKPLNSDQYEKYLEVTSNPDSAKNNPYLMWVDNSLYILIVDQNGAGSGEGVAKVIKIEDGSAKQYSCFYYSPEKFSDVNSIRTKKSDAGDLDCDNYSIKLLNNN
ncbi:MAG: hypothetical protein ACD_22C00094G0005 [uncultured bacterium]|nr:MAG: hypothetical protein ACD_22C00094G0005 [uncultured bacterium]